MSKLNLRRLLIISVCAVALAAQVPVAPPAAAQGNAQRGGPPGSAGSRVSFSPVHVFSPLNNGAIIEDAYSQLVRSKNGVTMTFHTQGLTPGTVVTVWWVFFNNPDACFDSPDPCRLADVLSNPAAEPSLLYAGGKVVGPNGTLNIGAHRAVGDTSGSEPIHPPFPIPNPGLLDPMEAEVHLVVRTHGVALEGDQLIQQLTTFNGGCPPNMCTNLQASIHQP